MNTKLFSLLGVAAALTFSIGVVNSAEAKPVSRSSDQLMLLAQGKKPELNLTDEQKAQMKEIRESTRTQIDNVLTEEQRNQLQAAREQGGKKRSVWSSLNLTEEQKAEIKRIRQESKQRMEAILTPEQRQQMQQMRQNWSRNRGQNRPQQQ